MVSDPASLREAEGFSMGNIIFRHVGFHYEAPYAEVFRDLDLLIDTRWRTGLIGRNGRGKTTLLGMIHGDLAPGTGSLTVPVTTVRYPLRSADSGESVFNVIKDAVAPFRAWEAQMNVLVEVGTEAAMVDYGEIQARYADLGGYDIDARIMAELPRMEFEEALLERSFDSLSGGEQTRALIAALFLQHDAYPLIDEPTDHLDLPGREIVARYLADKPGFLLVSHDRWLLDQCVDHVVSINKADVRAINGNYSVWKEQSDREEEFERRRKENLQREIKSLERAARQRRDGALKRERDKTAHTDKGYIGHRARKQMKRALAIERRVERNLDERRNLLKNEEKERRLKIAQSEQSAQSLIIANDLSLAIGDSVLFEHVSFNLQPRDRIAVIGPNGSGKTSLLRAIMGKLEPREGVIRRPAHVRFACSYQNPRWQRGLLRTHLRREGIDETRFRQILGVLGVEGEVFERDLATMSQGQRKKVDLATSFIDDADFLLWDEPMNYLDVRSREQLEEAVLEFEPTLVFVEHDHYFVDRVATKRVRIPS
jgi:lincosamide and streptogramin A transport system ATP-binding/permease protein